MLFVLKLFVLRLSTKSALFSKTEFKQKEVLLHQLK